MAAFDYTAIDKAGRKQKGVLQADSERQAREILMEKALLPVEVKAAQKENKSSASIGWVSGLRSSEKADFTRQFAVLVDSGVPVDEALLAISKQHQSVRIKRLVLALRSDVLEGRSLSESIGKQPRTFDALYRSMVEAGEESGALGKVLMRLADHQEQRRELDQSVTNAMVYPMILVIVAIAIISVLMTYVVPKVVSQFDRASQQLPWMTELLITISDLIRHYGVFAVLLAVIVFTGIRVALRNPKIKVGFEKAVLRLPVIKGVVTNLVCARFARAMDIMVSSGMPLLDAMKVGISATGHLFAEHQLRRVAEQVAEGTSLETALRKMSFMPPLVVCMIGNGERSGNLAGMFSRTATILEQTVSARIRVAMALFEPLLILVMGAVVLFIVMAILLPLLELNNMTML